MISSASCQAILFLIFNRLDTTRKVFQSIREAKPPRLYIASDGPRLAHKGEEEQVQSVRKYVLASIDWDCEIKTLYREANLGCKMAVESAITWFFDHEESGIILEDDCVPDLSFFCFCQELLAYYQNDNRVMAISGSNLQLNRKQRDKYSYYFSRYPHCWGWATWRRAWHLYDKEMQLWPEIRDNEWLKDILSNRSEERYRYRTYQKIYEKKYDSWAYLWEFTCWVQGGLTVLPRTNLVSNIGYSSQGTHTHNTKSPFSNLATRSMEFPLLHPPFMIRDSKADSFTRYLVCNYAPRVIRKIKGFLPY